MASLSPILLKRLLAACALLGLSSLACAQYVWTDERGVKQYSDQPPPASTPASRILKSPGLILKSDPAAPAAPVKAGPSLADRNADFNKRRLEQAEKDKKATEDAAAAAELRSACEQARNYRRTLESGSRITRTESNGEKAFLSDAQRAQETADIDKLLVKCK